jgi:hypothetical protein
LFFDELDWAVDGLAFLVGGGKEPLKREFVLK